MKYAADNFISWAIAEIFLTALLFAGYRILLASKTSARNRYRLLKYGLIILPLLPFLAKIPLGTLFYSAVERTLSERVQTTSFLPTFNVKVAETLNLFHTLGNFLVIVYGLVVTRLLSNLSKSWARLNRIKRESTLKFFQDKIPVLLSKENMSPFTVGVRVPCIIFPQRLFEDLSDEEIESVLSHEMHHIRRHDYFSNLIISIVRSLLFFSPFTWSLGRAHQEDMELSCDAWVVEQDGHSIKIYGQLLLRLTTGHCCDSQREAPALFQSRRFISKRIMNITKNDLRPNRSIMIGLPPILMLTSCLILNAMSLHAQIFTDDKKGKWEITIRSIPKIIGLKVNGNEVQIGRGIGTPLKVNVFQTGKVEFILSAPGYQDYTFSVEGKVGDVLEPNVFQLKPSQSNFDSQ